MVTYLIVILQFSELITSCSFCLNCTNYNTNTYINCPDNNSPFIKSYITQDKIMLLEKGMTSTCDCDYK